MSGPVGDFTGTDRYTIHRRIGVGAMGVVYDAFDKARGERVALKTLIHADPSAIYRLKHEFRALADVSHPNLVSLYELTAVRDDWFITMELIDGVQFLEYVRPNDRLDEGRLRSALRQLAQGVYALQAAGRVHRDLKPSNVLVTSAGRVTVLDFGISLEMQPRDGMQTSETSLIGTVFYMSPEQSLGNRGGGPSDWYAVGVMLYEALTGSLPFDGPATKVLHDKQTLAPPSPAERVPGLPDDLVEICNALLVRDPARRMGGEALLRRLGVDDPTRSLTVESPKRSSRLIGRISHLAELEDALGQTRQRHPTAVYLHGTSGMGKSTLVRTFLDTVAERDGAVLLEGRCFDRESMPYKALDGVIDSLTRYLRNLTLLEVQRLLPLDVFAISRMFPVIMRVEAIADVPYRLLDSPDPIEMRRRAFAALRELLARIADRRPLIVHIDDLQWADLDSITLLEDLLRPPEAPPLLLIASFRSEEIEQKAFLGDLLAAATTPQCRELRVNPLSDEEARSLALELLSPFDAPDALVDALVREATGSPFLLEQLVQHVRDEEGVADTSISLSDMLDARIRRLPDGARALLDTLAIAGHPLSPSVALRTAGLTDDTRPLLSRLRIAHMIRATGDGDRIEVYHDRIREALAARLDAAAARWVHLNLAEALASSASDDPEALFEHYVGSGDKQRAAVHAVRAAKRAASALAFERAARFYRHAIELGASVTGDRWQLQAALGEALANAGRPAEAADAYLDAADGADRTKALEYRRRAAEQLLVGGHRERGLQVIRDLAAALGIYVPRGARRALLSLLVSRARIALRGIHWVERPAEQIPEDALFRMDVCWTCAVGLTLIDYIIAADFQARYLLLALDAGEPYRVARALAIETGFTAAKGGRSRARTDRLVAESAALAERLQSPRELGLAAVTAGSAAFLRGEWRRAADLCTQAETILTDRCTGVLWETTTARTFLMSSLIYLGELARMRKRHRELLVTANERGDLLLATEVETRLSFAWLVSDEPGEARRHVEAALGRWSTSGYHRQHYNALLALCNIDLYAGDVERAWTRLEGEWPKLQRSLLPRIQILRAEALFLRARCALARAASLVRAGRPGFELTTLLGIAERIANQLEGEQMPWIDPFVPCIRGSIARLREERPTAAALLRLALDGFERADMALYAAATRRRLGELQGGDAGAGQVEEANRFLRAQTVDQPDRMTAVLAPGVA
ncbi:MAG: protein kinase [Gemmatimonadota bacterium]|nr:protein kinase [Gemmatimonadota bacterium]